MRKKQNQKIITVTFIFCNEKEYNEFNLVQKCHIINVVHRKFRP